MAYYDALVTKWNTLSGTTAQKLVLVNAATVTGSVPTSFYITGSQLLNCINWTEFAALTAAQQSNLLALCNSPGQILGGSANTSHMAAGMIIAYFSLQGATVAALTALAQAIITPWPTANGYSYPMTLDDVTAAGLS